MQRQELFKPTPERANKHEQFSLPFNATLIRDYDPLGRLGRAAIQVEGIPLQVMNDYFYRGDGDRLHNLQVYAIRSEERPFLVFDPHLEKGGPPSSRWELPAQQVGDLFSMWPQKVGDIPSSRGEPVKSLQRARELAAKGLVTLQEDQATQSASLTFVKPTVTASQEGSIARYTVYIEGGQVVRIQSESFGTAIDEASFIKYHDEESTTTIYTYSHDKVVRTEATHFNGRISVVDL